MWKKKQEDVKVVEEVREELSQDLEKSEELSLQESQEQVVKKTVKVKFENDVMFWERYVWGVTHELSTKDFQKLAKTSFKYRVV